MRTALDTAKTHLDRLPPAISGASGHDATFRAACWLVKCGLSDIDAMSLLRQYNQRCQPPWTEKELVHKLTDARRVVTARLNFTSPSRPPVRVVWKVSRTLQPRQEAPPQKEPSIVRRQEDAPQEVAGAVVPVDSNHPQIPWITKQGDLVIPFGSPARYHWWNGGQSVGETLAELRLQHNEVCPDVGDGPNEPKSSTHRNTPPKEARFEAEQFELLPDQPATRNT